jgi:hypothetical protein
MKHPQQFRPKQKLFNGRFFDYIFRLNPFRGELVEVEMKVVGKRIIYTYTKVRETH